ncbi:MAG TPA: hypothetical protein VL463_28370 [Kofleriaceae bacterium]|nr:hypothetical protein [Kofleriaceae bacterium]
MASGWIMGRRSYTAERLVCNVLKGRPAVQGRITERQLPLAEKSFPGIGRFYRDLSEKPATFLQLVWMFEACRAGVRKAAQPVRRKAR